MRPRLVYAPLITVLTSEDETPLMMAGAENDENEVPTQGVFLPLPLLPFPGNLQISN